MDYITLNNRIKDLFDESWLTESQQAIYKMIIKRYRTHEMVNIYGEPGTGKTFLGWNIAETMKGVYTKDINDTSSETLVVLDNWSYKKQDVRAILPIMKFNCIKKVIVITEKEVRDDIVSLELLFTDSDRKIFKHNLWEKFNLDFVKEKDNDNMHSLIKANMR